MNTPVKSPFEILADYERRALTHSGAGQGGPALVADRWRGIGFRVGDRRLVSSLTEVDEVLSFSEVTRVPGGRTWLLGVGSVRGALIPLIDLKGFLTSTVARASDASRVLLVRQSGGSVGLLVDEVVGLLDFGDDQRADVPTPEADDGFARYVVDHYALNGVSWGLFSMAALVQAHEFSQAAA